MIKIKENAIFIADSHYPHHGDAFTKFIKTKLVAHELKKVSMKSKSLKRVQKH